MQTSTTKGFTLVELAIVMTIIGLLIGGILKGQELIENARVTATIAQVKSFEAATSTFRDRFDSLPGDMPSAATRLPGCTPAARCNPGTAAGTGGNSIVGDPAWASGWGSQTTGGAGTAQFETQLFWAHLLLADLISGVSDAQVRAATTPAWGITHPSARIGGGFVVGHGNATIPPGSTATAGTGPSGMIVVITQSPSDALSTTSGLQAMTASRAAQIDRKLDDGRPTSGYVQAYGTAASCFAGTAADTFYDETRTTRDCGLVFRIQG
jgi:prepilin-type N-terminal cleavage/methylation domain-containing protein